MSSELTEEEMRRALFGTPQPEVNRPGFRRHLHALK